MSVYILRSARGDRFSLGDEPGERVLIGTASWISDSRRKLRDQWGELPPFMRCMQAIGVLDWDEAEAARFRAACWKLEVSQTSWVTWVWLDPEGLRDVLADAQPWDGRSDAQTLGIKRVGRNRAAISLGRPGKARTFATPPTDGPDPAEPTAADIVAWA
ncbi:hypothetical protein [Singulisphaera acidiphila]|uniref:Uncharacterized protein n=1 Tax=Singulisphaera acidiphila (strain ATCC BAA-1392 / DSM 18658 / VKM B-2454 / MOB10) TaxID=886293 RepID=L0DRR2_SINAD|nr:hypothetical protein [Singulisphaera acidiphila]AGA31672.1 hypothetical protein Sinac_7642 [Singulisphaera acidiphila DSM 18658]